MDFTTRPVRGQLAAYLSTRTVTPPLLRPAVTIRTEPGVPRARRGVHQHRCPVPAGTSAIPSDLRGRLLDELHAAVVDQLRILDEHIIWVGAMCSAGDTSDGQARGFFHGRAWVDGESVEINRVVWSAIVGENLGAAERLRRRPGCPHDRCVSPTCFDKS